MTPNDRLPRGPLSRGVLSRHAGCPVETVRYYERVGLLSNPPRWVGQHRRYDETHLRRLVFIRRARALGFSIDAIRKLLGLVDSSRLSCADVHDRAIDHLQSVRDRIVGLQQVARSLEALAASCDGRQTPECPLMDHLFAEADPTPQAGRSRRRKAKGKAASPA